MSTSGLTNAHMTTEDGADIAYRIRRGRDPLVLIHGLGCDASMWDTVVAALPHDVGLVIPELRGHGGSTLGWLPPSVDQWADDVVRADFQIHWNRVELVLWTHDLGGLSEKDFRMAAKINRLA